MRIEDGKGKNGDMSVSKSQRGDVSARSAPRAMYSARDEGLSFAAIYHFTAAAGEYVAYLKNTSSTKNLFLHRLVIGGVNSVLWKLFFVTGTAAAGATVTATPTNKAKSIPAEVIAMDGDTAITGLTVDGQFAAIRSVAAKDSVEEFDGTIQLGPGDALAVEYDTGTGGIGEVSLHFHLEDL